MTWRSRMEALAYVTSSAHCFSFCLSHPLFPSFAVMPGRMTSAQVGANNEKKDVMWPASSNKRTTNGARTIDELVSAFGELTSPPVLCTPDRWFRFVDRCYQEIHGTPIGSLLESILADVFVPNLDQKMICGNNETEPVWSLRLWRICDP